MTSKLNTMISTRNVLLGEFFEANGFEVKLLGDKNQPAIILNDSICVSGYVKNFDYNFTSKIYNGDVIHTIKLETQTNIDPKKVRECIKGSEHRNMFRIHYSGESSLMLVDFNKSNGKTIPVWGKENPKLYFSEVRAEKTLKYLEHIGCAGEGVIDDTNLSKHIISMR